MNQEYKRKKQFGRMLVAVAIAVCAVVGLMVCSPGGGSHAQQQDRNRQLTHPDAQGSARAGEGKRIALVIGNGGYTNAPPLKNPTNDAADMAEALSGLGFKVDDGVNLTQKQMKFMIRQFGQKLKAGGACSTSLVMACSCAGATT